ncbi:hypothetical protein LHP98_08695 [Rhodobacter sp. Har01]|uniref:hypothetical protein n=1 Tax=Rhodobacter sp. Har01 TaxID=2883999 RepID=UPI001D06A6E4|nr:hypothetical protein [Rhodobacter sp. Har01]MCB6178206.1 hypothetical protein [Rhodobacter sp. Har01]
MKPLILSATTITIAAAIALSALPSLARDMADQAFVQARTDDSLDKRRKPRIKGGSGCDDAGDIAEHPACR